MNGQAFRRKLELAVEQRDPSALKQLESIAGECPVTERIWEDHLLVEQAIAQWRKLPEWQGAVEPQVQAVSDKHVRGRSRAGLRLAAGLSLGLCLLAGGLLWRGSINTAEVAEMMPVGAAASEESLLVSSPLEQGAGEVQYALQESTAVEQVEPAASLLLNYTVAIADRGRTFIPGVGLIPALQDVTLPLEQGMGATWEVISNLPAGMQEAWQRLYLQEENLQQVPEAEGLNGQEGEAPRRPHRRSRPSRVFSLDEGGVVRQLELA